MTVQKIKWVAIGLVVGVIAGGATASWAVKNMYDSIISGFGGEEFQMTKLEMIELEHVDSGNYPAAMDLMVDRIFVGLTRIHENQEDLVASYRTQVGPMVHKLAEFRDSNPEYFENKPDWWIERLEEWIAESNAPTAL